MLAYRIKKAREAKGLKQEEFAEIIGVGRGSVANWETDYVQPKGERLNDISKALGVTVEWLLDTTNDDNEFLEGQNKKDRSSLDPFMVEVGERLRKLRNKRDLALREVGEKFFIKLQTIGGYERGEREPALQTLTQFAELYEVTTDYLLGYTLGKEIDVEIEDEWITEIKDAPEHQRVAMKEIWNTIKNL